MPVSKKHNQPKQRKRKKPRISLNKLGEYAAEANPARRHRIIRDQKYPSDYIGPYYGPIRDGIVKYVAGGEKDLNHLREAIASLEKKAAGSSRKKQRLKSCRDAAASFVNGFDAVLPQDSLRASATRRNDPSSLWIGGVRVSVRPDLLISGKDGNGKEVVGVAKLHFSKGHPLNEKSGKYVATMLHQFAEDQISDADARTFRKQCMVLDVFTEERHVAPRAYKRRREALDAACLEIESKWPRV